MKVTIHRLIVKVNATYNIRLINKYQSIDLYTQSSLITITKNSNTVCIQNTVSYHINIIYTVMPRAMAPLQPMVLPRLKSQIKTRFT